ncbi:MAG: hypothetical protein IPJ03_22430 [Ignavibacteriales bacterium]|nr:hypothetical protein [Ignavibacteriales bacterium]
MVTEFLHERKDGLGVCLLEASKSVDKKKWRELKDLLNYKKPGGDTPG